MNSEREVPPWPSGEDVGPPQRAVGQDNLSAHPPRRWADTGVGGGDAMESSSPLSMGAQSSPQHHSPGPVPAGRAELVPILWHIPGDRVRNCTKRGAGAAVPAGAVRRSCLRGKGLLLCQVRQSLYTS